MNRTVSGLISFALLSALICSQAQAKIFVETYPTGAFKAQGDPQFVDIDAMFDPADDRDASTGNEIVDMRIGELRAHQARFAAGYIPIGDLRANDEKCNDAECTRLQRKVRKRARRMGADLIDEVFANDRERRGTRQGKCLQWTTVNAQEYYCPPIGGASCRYRDVRRKQCIQSETVLTDKVKRQRTAHYNFWRHEPALAKDAYLAAGLAIEVLKMNKDGVDLWLGRGADIRYPYAKAPLRRLMSVIRYKYGKNGLTDADVDRLRAHRLDFVKFLITRGADPEPKPVKSWFVDSPILRAHEDNDHDLVKLLLESGASAWSSRLTVISRGFMKCSYKEPCQVGSVYYNDENTEQRTIDLLVEYEKKEDPTRTLYAVPDGTSRDHWDWKGW